MVLRNYSFVWLRGSLREWEIGCVCVCVCVWACWGVGALVRDRQQRVPQLSGNQSQSELTTGHTAGGAGYRWTEDDERRKPINIKTTVKDQTIWKSWQGCKHVWGKRREASSWGKSVDRKEFQTKVRTGLRFCFSHDSAAFSRSAPSSVSVCGSAAVHRCISGLYTSSLQGESGGCTHPVHQRCRDGCQGLRGSNWGDCLQNGGRPFSRVRRSSQGGAQAQSPPGPAQGRRYGSCQLCPGIFCNFQRFLQKKSFIKQTLCYQSNKCF